MSNVIATDLQTQEIDSELIELFEVTLPNGTTLYFHPGLDSDSTDLQFRDKTSPYAIRDYIAMPIMIDGLELQADGASNRPSFTVANIGSLFQSELGGFKNDDLIGQRLKRRQTLRKYLVGENNDASPPIEFSTQEYVIDRVREENALSITYEVATPFDLQNIQIPRRIVVGKYCSWKYQGHASGEGGGCTWNTDGAVNYNGDGTIRAHKAYFDFDDRPLIASESITATFNASTAYTTSDYITHGGKFWVRTVAGTGNAPSTTSAYWKEVRKWTEWASGTTYQIGTLVRYNAVTIWKARIISTGQIPTDTSPYWVREEICGKTLQSCKARYGFKPSVLTSANQKPEGSTNLAARLPFGSFPGTLKY
jgi:lambda family phage minor tail protein L